jgi:hypothetical protein
LVGIGEVVDGSATTVAVKASAVAVTVEVFKKSRRVVSDMGLNIFVVELKKLIIKLDFYAGTHGRAFPTKTEFQGNEGIHYMIIFIYFIVVM